MSGSIRGYSAERTELTPGMLAVAALGARGFTTAAMAHELGKSCSTILSIRAALMARTGAPNFTAAVAIVVRRGQA